MPIATTVRRAAFNNGYMGTVNLYVSGVIAATPATPLTIGGDLVLTPVHELPNQGWKCEVTTTPAGSDHLLIRPGEVVSG